MSLNLFEIFIVLDILNIKYYFFDNSVYVNY